MASSPDGSELYYVHHARPTPTDPHRWLYTERIDFGTAGSDLLGFPIISIDQSTSDQPVPSGVAPYSIRASAASLRLRPRGRTALSWRVSSARGARLALSNPLNRVRAISANPDVAAIEDTARGATVRAGRSGRTTITLTYQRELASGAYRNVYDITDTHRQPVSVTVAVEVGGSSRPSVSR